MEFDWWNYVITTFEDTLHSYQLQLNCRGPQNLDTKFRNLFSRVVQLGPTSSWTRTLSTRTIPPPNIFQTMPWMSEVTAPRGPVAYDSSNHCQILFQCFGSLWPRVRKKAMNSGIQHCLSVCLTHTASVLLISSFVLIIILHKYRFSPIVPQMYFSWFSSQNYKNMILWIWLFLVRAIRSLGWLCHS